MITYITKIRLLSIFIATLLFGETTQSIMHSQKGKQEAERESYINTIHELTQANAELKQDNISLKQANDQLLKRNTELTEENQYICEEYEGQMDTQKQELEKLGMELLELEGELEKIYQNPASNGIPALVFHGREKEFYDGEIKEIIMEALACQLKSTKENSRKAHILTDVIRYNDISGIQRKRRQEIKQILNGYSVPNKRMLQELKNFGFTVEKGRKHYNLLYYGDARYKTTLASSGSDSYRGGKNLAGEIITDML